VATWRWKHFENVFIRFDRIHERDGRTDWHMDTAWRLRPRLHSIARQKSRNTFSGTRIYVPLPKFCQNSFLAHNFTEIGLSAADSYVKNVFQYGGRTPSWILEIFIFGHVAEIKFRTCCCVPNFNKIGWFFFEIWRFNDCQDGACPPSWICEIQSLRDATSVAMLFCFLVQSFTEVGQSVAELWPKMIFKMADVHHFEF